MQKFPESCTDDENKINGLLTPFIYITHYSLFLKSKIIIMSNDWQNKKDPTSAIVTWVSAHIHNSERVFGGVYASQRARSLPPDNPHYTDTHPQNWTHLHIIQASANQLAQNIMPKAINSLYRKTAWSGVLRIEDKERTK